MSEPEEKEPDEPTSKFVCKMVAKLHEKGPLTKTRLAEEIGADPETVRKRAKLVENIQKGIKVIDADEGRTTFITLADNDKGKELLENLMRICPIVRETVEKKQKQPKRETPETATDGGSYLDNGDVDDGDPEIPQFTKMEAQARKIDVKPYPVHGSSRHKAGFAVLRNGKARYWYRKR